MKLELRVVLAVSVFAVAGVATWLKLMDPEPAVYLAALGGLSSDEIAIASSPGTCGESPRIYKDLPEQLVESYIQANAPDAGFGDVSRLSFHFAVANSRQLAALESQGLSWWTAGDRRLRIVRLSRVGFSKDGKEALLCVSAAHITDLVRLRLTEQGWQATDIRHVRVA